VDFGFTDRSKSRILRDCPCLVAKYLRIRAEDPLAGSVNANVRGDLSIELHLSAVGVFRPRLDLIATSGIRPLRWLRESSFSAGP
jgi:hypothetical protein